MIRRSASKWGILFALPGENIMALVEESTWPSTAKRLGAIPYVGD